MSILLLGRLLPTTPPLLLPDNTSDSRLAASSSIISRSYTDRDMEDSTNNAMDDLATRSSLMRLGIVVVVVAAAVADDVVGRRGGRGRGGGLLEIALFPSSSFILDLLLRLNPPSSSMLNDTENSECDDPRLWILLRTLRSFVSFVSDMHPMTL